MSRIAICGYSSSVGKGFISRYDTQFEFVKLGRRNDADISLDLRERALKGIWRRFAINIRSRNL